MDPLKCVLRCMVVVMILHSKVDVGDTLPMKSVVVRHGGPVLFGPIRIVMPEMDIDRRPLYRCFNHRPQKLIVPGPRGVDLVIGVDTDHVHIDIHNDLLQRNHRVIHEVVRTPQAHLLSIQSNKQDAVLRWMLTEPSASRQQSARTRCVVISPVVDLTVRDTEMVEVRSDDDITIRMLTALHIPHDVGHLLHVTLSAGMAMVKWLLPAAVKRAQPGGFKMPADVCSRFPTPFTPGEADRKSV